MLVVSRLRALFVRLYKPIRPSMVLEHLGKALAQFGLPETDLLLRQLLERHRFDLGDLDLTIGGLLAFSECLQLLGNAVTC